MTCVYCGRVYWTDALTCDGCGAPRDAQMAVAAGPAATTARPRPARRRRGIPEATLTFAAVIVGSLWAIAIMLVLAHIPFQ